MSPQLSHVFTLRGLLASDSIDVGNFQSGPKRIIGALEGGFLRGVAGTHGEGMDATLLSGGSDWVLLDEGTGVTNIDVRTHGKTSNGEGVYVQYTGVFKADPAAIQFLTDAPEAKTTQFGDHHWWCRPLIETNGKWR